MKILVGHNFYQQPGGEDAVAKLEVDLLRRQGHEVLFVELSNKDFNDLSISAKIRNIFSWSWSQSSYELIRKHCLEFHPDIAHFHNTFFMMTPSVYEACRSVGVPVVQTLHNFRLLCSNGLFYRRSLFGRGHTCEECLNCSLSRGIIYSCYRKSKILTWAVVRMLEQHRQRKTWINQVDAFIALTDFARCKFVQGGLPKEKVWVKPNSISIDLGVRTDIGDYFVFAGRLSEEKGVMVLLDAFRTLPEVKLIIMGDGPLRRSIEEYIQEHSLSNIYLKGFLQKDTYWDIFKKAKAVIVPSVCYENFPMTIVEAFACGIPVIASGHGAMQELIQDHGTGFLFKPGDASQLRDKINTFIRESQIAVAMGLQARQQYEERFSAPLNYQQLMSIYEQARKNFVTKV